ncbi:helix-turn-helix domain-containing protein [Escherichia coli]|uniref:helix-turn-helix domain-containing protein n=1 Tax=Escherichia coli TaxID=562 RepID=UPI003EE9064C
MDKAKISSITELARRLQLNQPTLHRLVSGEVKDPKIRNVKADRRLLPRVTNRLFWQEGAFKKWRKRTRQV